MTVSNHQGNRVVNSPLIALIASSVMAACGDGARRAHTAGTTQPSPQIARTASTGAPAALTIAEVYRRAAQMLDQPAGTLYHVTIQRTEQTIGAQDPEGLGASTTEIWVDAQRNVARTQTRRVRDGWITIVTPHGQYTLAQPNDEMSESGPLLCPSTSVAVAVVLGCPDAPFETYTFATPDGAPQREIRTPAITVAPSQDAAHPTVLVTALKQQQPYRSAPVTETRQLSLCHNVPADHR